MCNNSRVYLNVILFVLFLLPPWFRSFYQTHVQFRDVLYVSRCFSIIRITLICSSYLVLKFLPVWPMYCRGQCMHFNLYTSGFSYLSVVTWLGNKRFLRLFVVLNTVFMLVFLNSLVMYLVSFPTYVNAAHLLFSGISWVVCGAFGFVYIEF
jgi:hypothetical protein